MTVAKKVSTKLKQRTSKGVIQSPSVSDKGIGPDLVQVISKAPALQPLSSPEAEAAPTDAPNSSRNIEEHPVYELAREQGWVPRKPEFDGQKQAERWLALGAKSKTTVLERGEIAVAIDRAPDVQQLIFWRHTQLKRQSSKFRKFLVIGQQSERLRLIIDVLPDEWTTIYKLASLEPDEFKLLKNDGRLHQEATAKFIDDILAGMPKDPNEQVAWEEAREAEKSAKAARAEKARILNVVVVLDGLEPSIQVKAYKELVHLGDSLGFKIEPSDALKKIVAEQGR